MQSPVTEQEKNNNNETKGINPMLRTSTSPGDATTRTVAILIT
jgi:hypothetical protein